MDVFRTARENFLRRQRQAEEDDLERQRVREEALEAPRAPQPEMAERSPAPSMLHRFTNFQRPSVQTFFSRRSSRNPETQQIPRPTSSRYSQQELDSPKTPLFNLGMPGLPSTRLHLPNLARTWTQGSNGPPSRPGTAAAQAPAPQGHARGPSGSSLPGQRFPVVTEPAPAADPERRSNHTRTSSGRRFSGVDPAELHLANMADDGRRRRRRGERRSERSDDPERRRRRRRRRDDESERSSRREPPKHFLFCFPWIKSKRIRSHVLRCFVSGIFLTLLLSTYLALSLTNNISSSEFTILLILVILGTTVVFCHGLIRLCMLIVRPPPEDDENAPRDHPEMTMGYAIPREPIRVVLARDEEAAGIESEATKTHPPAYGLWRESVRVDPNRIYWQRNEEAQPDAVPEDDERPSTRGSGSSSGGSGRPTRSQRRPPSYASDDGVEYVVEARPRSMAPLSDVPLPQHPSEMGRTGRPAGW